MGKIKIELYKDDGSIKSSKEYFIEKSEQIGKGLISICEFVEENELEEKNKTSIISSLRKTSAIGEYESIKKTTKKIFLFIKELNSKYRQFEIHYEELQRIVNKKLYFSAKEKYSQMKDKPKRYTRTSLINHITHMLIKRSFDLLLELRIIGDYEFEYVPMQNSYIIIVKAGEEKRPFDECFDEAMKNSDRGMPKIAKQKFEELKQKNYIDYVGILKKIKAGRELEYNSLVGEITKVIPNYWYEKYDMMKENNNIHLIRTVPTFEYAFDMQENGESTAADRVVVVYGVSKINSADREENYMQGYLKGGYFWQEQNIDKGHFIAHSIGGDEGGINFFIQKKDINRGISERGKVYRAMETYCANNEGTFCFSRPIYCEESDLPFIIEYGVLKQDGEIWIEMFENVDIE